MRRRFRKRIHRPMGAKYNGVIRIKIEASATLVYRASTGTSDVTINWGSNTAAGGVGN